MKNILNSERARDSSVKTERLYCGVVHRASKEQRISALRTNATFYESYREVLKLPSDMLFFCNKTFCLKYSTFD